MVTRVIMAFLTAIVATALLVFAFIVVKSGFQAIFAGLFVSLAAMISVAPGLLAHAIGLLFSQRRVRAAAILAGLVLNAVLAWQFMGDAPPTQEQVGTSTIVRHAASKVDSFDIGLFVIVVLAITGAGMFIQGRVAGRTERS